MANLPAERLATLAQLVKDTLHNRDLTRQAFAQRAGISRMTLRAIERGGEHQPTQETLEKLARFMRVPVEHLIGHKAGALDLTWTNLRSEDQQIGREFHHAATDVKFALKRLFSADITDEQRERLARILQKLQNLTPDDPLLASIEQLLTAHPPNDEAAPEIDAKRGGKKG